jgi:hypothetical protein
MKPSSSSRSLLKNNSFSAKKDHSFTAGRPPSSPAAGSRYNHENFATSPKSAATNTSEMLDVKVHRKRAESDLQLLANRIALLRVEEQKALNKVTETKARAEEILE